MSNSSAQYTIHSRKKKLSDTLLFFHHRKIERALQNLAEKYNNSSSRIIELGSGTNALAHKHIFSKAQFAATDLKICEGIDFTVDITDAKNLPDNTYDLVICMNVLEHIFHPQSAINEMHRILKKDSELFLVTPFLFPVHDPPFDFYRYTEYSLKAMLKDFQSVSTQKVFLFSKYSLFERLILYYVIRAVK